MSPGPHPPQHGKQCKESLPRVAKGPSVPRALANSQVSVAGKRQAHITSAPTHETTDTSNPTVRLEGSRQWRTTQVSNKSKNTKEVCVPHYTPKRPLAHLSLHLVYWLVPK